MSFTPTPEQAAIVAFVRDNPETNLMIEAVAGAAKTSTMVLAAEHIGEQYSPLALAFNKRNADDLAARMPPHFACLTMNSLGHRAWGTRLAKRLTLDDDKIYKAAKAIVPSTDARDSEDLVTVMTLVKTAKSIGLVPLRAPMGVKGLVPDEWDNWQEIAFVKGLDLVDTHVLQARDVLLRSINEAFQGTIDFADQIYMSVLFGGTFPRYHTVIVDESQDLSPLNHLQLKRCTAARLIAVGDPCQAIYAFRGADAESMANLASMMGENGVGSIGKAQFKKLALTKSFRVPHAIGKRQRHHVPHFGTMDWLPEGSVESWPKASGPGRTDEPPRQWSIDDVPKEGFVICRNNAPLMRLGFAMIKARRAVKILGRDIGASLASALLKATGKTEKPIGECWALVEAWKQKELEKADDSESKRDVVFDRAECMEVMLDAEFSSNSKGTNLSTAEFIRSMFSDKIAQDTTLSSGHRIKGMESKWCMHLDPWRVPSKQALKADERGDPRSLVQERNLAYVIETRTQHTLVLANLDDCLEIGE